MRKMKSEHVYYVPTVRTPCVPTRRPRHKAKEMRRHEHGSFSSYLAYIAIESQGTTSDAPRANADPDCRLRPHKRATPWLFSTTNRRP